MRSHYFIAEIARQFGVPPRRISDAFYHGKLDNNRCDFSSGKRLVPADYIATIEAALQAAGHLPIGQEAARAI